MATTGGPGGSCQPHTVQQLTREKERGGGRRGSGGETKGLRNQKEYRREGKDGERAKPERVPRPSLSQPCPLSQFQQEATSPLDSNRRGKAIGLAPV